MPPVIGEKTFTLPGGKVQEYVQLATESYELDTNGSVFGYTRVNDYTKDNSDSGFRGCVFENDNEVVIAYSGTSNMSEIVATGCKMVAFGQSSLPLEELDEYGELKKGDSGSNANLMEDEVPLQYQDALGLYNDVRNDPKFKGKQIVIVGHSLGGALAQIVASTGDEEGNMPELHAVTFNALGTKALVDKPNDNIKDFGNTYNYIIEGDQVASVKEHPGTTITLEKRRKHIFDFRTHSLKYFTKDNIRGINDGTETTYASNGTLGNPFSHNPSPFASNGFISCVMQTFRNVVSSFANFFSGKMFCQA